MTKSRRMRTKQATQATQKKADEMPLNAIQFLHWLQKKYPNKPGLSADIQRFLNGSEGAKNALRERVKEQKQ